jgi:hypothetical protein
MAHSVYELSSAHVDYARSTGRIIRVCKPLKAGNAARNGHSTGANLVNCDGCAVMTKLPQPPREAIAVRDADSVQ